MIRAPKIFVFLFFRPFCAIVRKASSQLNKTDDGLSSNLTWAATRRCIDFIRSLPNRAIVFFLIACLRFFNLDYRGHVFAIPIFFLIFSISLSGQSNSHFAQNTRNPIHFEHVLEEWGIRNLIQCDRGFLWINTMGSVARFDGQETKTYHSSKEFDFVTVYVEQLVESGKGEFWVITMDGGLHRYDVMADSIKPFPLFSDEKKEQPRPFVTSLVEDGLGTVWIGTRSHGLFRLDTHTGKLIPQNLGHRSFQDTIYQLGKGRKKGEVWIAANYLYCMRPDSEHAMEWSTEPYPQVPSNLTKSIWATKNGEVWLGGYTSQVTRFNPATGSISQYYYDEDKGTARANANWVNTFYEDEKGTIWIGTDAGGICLIDPVSGRRDFVKYNRHDPKSLSSDIVVDIYKDKTGIVWIGTWGAGLNKYNPMTSRFGHHYSIQATSNTLAHPSANVFHEAPDGSVWIGSDDGLTKFDRKTGSFERNHFPEKIGASIFAIQSDVKGGLLPAGGLWVGTAGGLMIFDDQKGQFSKWRSPSPETAKLEEDYIYFLEIDANGTLWAVSCEPYSLFYYDVEKRRFQFVDAILDSEHGCEAVAIPDRQDHLWVGTENDGFYKFDFLTSTNTHYHLHPNDSSGFPTLRIGHAVYDQNGRQWFGNEKGLFLMDASEGNDKIRFRHFSKTDGLSGILIQDLLEDNNGNLWLSSESGLSKITLEPGNPTPTILNFSMADGLQDNGFGYRTGLKSKRTGELFFGGGNGFNVFNPDSIMRDSQPPQLVFTDVQIFREGAMHSVSPGNRVWVSPSEKIMTIHFAALHFGDPEQNQYAYQMVGFDKNWRHVGHENEATYTNLDAGDYTFRVKAANYHGIWNEDYVTLDITVLPPWWATWWAYLFYFLAFVGAAFSLYYFLKKRWELNKKLELEQAEAHRLKELDGFKSRLYTNLTHEFRTPLTVILGMTQQILASPKNGVEKAAKLIENNGNNLLRLVNQLLDLSKLEDKSFKLNLQQSDIISYLRYLTESFQTYANSQNLSLRFFTTTKKLEMDFDPEQLKQVVTNFISNAVKFTPSGGDISVSANSENNRLQIEIKDNGIGISPNDLPHIFDRFYQVDGSTTRAGEGTGIGLAHSQELVKLMKGEISVESQLGQGTVFQINLPIQQSANLAILPLDHSKINEYVSTQTLAPVIAEDETELAAPAGELAKLLIIEDNPDVVIYLKSCLSEHYQLDIAYNGKIGIDKAIEEIPDLIISDVMMPEKDGYEVCDTLKNDERTSHIPIILLTAKADAASKIVGLRRGADAYLSKPFDKEELLVRLEMLLAKHRRLVAYFSNQLISDMPTITDIDMELQESAIVEDAFLRKVNDIIENNYEDENFGLPQLCQKVSMSRSQLFRKMKALRDISPSDYIRKFRLAKAKGLLENADFTVAEVAYQSGFKDPSYFSKLYQDEFGIVPSDTKK